MDVDKATPVSEFREHGVCDALGSLSDDAVITEEGLARLLGRSRKSIQRAVTRRELPAPVRLLGSRCWTAARIREHLGRRLDEAEREARELAARIARYSP